MRVVERDVVIIVSYLYIHLLLLPVARVGQKFVKALRDADTATLRRCATRDLRTRLTNPAETRPFVGLTSAWRCPMPVRVDADAIMGTVDAGIIAGYFNSLVRLGDGREGRLLVNLRRSVTLRWKVADFSFRPRPPESPPPYLPKPPQLMSPVKGNDRRGQY